MKNLISTKNKLKEIVENNKGGAMTILLLLLLPALMFIFISRTETTRLLRAADVTLNDAVTSIAKHSAMMVDPKSQSKGTPLIAYNKAYEVFTEEMYVYLNNNSNISKIKKWEMVIYNGTNLYEGYESYEIKPYVFYTSESNKLPEPEYIGEDDRHLGDVILYISDDGIDDKYTEGAIKVTLKDPGVLLVVQAEIEPVLVNKKETTTRWAYAKIVTKTKGDIK